MTTSMGNSNPLEYTASAVAFISSEGPDIHQGLGGYSQYSFQQDRFMPVNCHRSLEGLLQQYLPLNLGLQLPKNANELEQLSERLAGAEDRYNGEKNGFWHSIWYNLGEGEEVISNWIGLIPNEYGLAIVKTGLAVVFKLAERSAERRQKILNTFVAIRNALAKADPKRRNFRAHKDVAACAERLTQTITQSIEDMIKLTSAKPSWLKRLGNVPKPKQKTPQNPDYILERLAKSTREFEDVVNLARDNTIEATGYMAQSITSALPVMDDNIRGTYNRLQTMDRKQDVRDEESKMERQNLYTIIEEHHATLLGMAREQHENQLLARTTMVHLLRETKRLEAENKLLRRQQRFTPNFGGIIDEIQLIEILTLAPSFADGESSDSTYMLRQPNADLQLALTYKGKLNPESLRKVQTAVVTDTRVLEWLQCAESDLIMVDAKAINPGMTKISAISVFSATFITSMITARPEDVVVHYFCGQHFRPKDTWHGPNGLVRFIAMQLLMKLMGMKQVNLSFIRRETYVRKLEECDTWTLCHLLHRIVAQFPHEMTVCVVIDSISRIDTSRTSDELGVVMDHLHRIVTDPSLRPTVKVLLTSQMNTSRTLLQSVVFQDDPSRIVRLMPNKISRPLADMSGRVVRNMMF
ncbi:hypothetical protein BO94DRAFT_536021 [Aspergillus sclerotioniger CBS 115572]|uniref:Uncharacterized protein n=1 Tax=Aspergillus sclerotioniger CBS 115572 TaxID=1450535 RepID=A0A317WHG4_9EURO|nr:hypothetical protein BO94DRAFT_536021 [Aspergillus sclerotioniger CBS 115572]PWY85886.1 hypothetical protein BO94DRAFT_536021 [Aspergillus sclerotioniger CBS 115572]